MTSYAIFTLRVNALLPPQRGSVSTRANIKWGGFASSRQSVSTPVSATRLLSSRYDALDHVCLRVCASCLPFYSRSRLSSDLPATRRVPYAWMRVSS